MSKPEGIPQDVWDKAGDLAIDLARVGMMNRDASAVRGVVAHHQKAIVEAIMAAKAEEREACALLADAATYKTFMAWDMEGNDPFEVEIPYRDEITAAIRSRT